MNDGDERVALKEMFLKALQDANELPEDLRSRVLDVNDCEESCFDASYLAFLDEQIQLSPRGLEWTERLKRRREGLSPFCGVWLVGGHVWAGASCYWVKIDPRTRQVVYWEEYQAAELTRPGS